MNTHEKRISIAVAEGGRREEARFIGEIPSRPDAVTQWPTALPETDGELAFCLEAGLCGCGL